SKSFKENRMVTVSVTIKTDIPVHWVDDFLTSAFEGGINYWHHTKVKVVDNDWKDADFASDVVSRGGKVILTPDEPAYGYKKESYTLDLNKVIKGIEMACEHFGYTPTELYDNHDALIADVIVQYALWGEIVFG